MNLIGATIYLVTAGGDGSLMQTLKHLKANGVDPNRLVACPLPYGTGNDLSQVTNWGGRPSANFYSDLEDLIVEICENTKVKDINIWTVKAQMKEDGRILGVNS